MKKVVYNKQRENLREIIRTLCKYRRIEIIEGHMMSEHMHLLLSILPKISVSSLMKHLKDKMMFDKHANIKYKFSNLHFGSKRCYVSTVG